MVTCKFGVDMRRLHLPGLSLSLSLAQIDLLHCNYHQKRLCTNMVSLTTSDNEQFTVDRDVAERSILIRQMLEGKVDCTRLCPKEAF